MEDLRRQINLTYVDDPERLLASGTTTHHTIATAYLSYYYQRKEFY
jgi:hypothetical protein